VSGMDIASSFFFSGKEAKALLFLEKKFISIGDAQKTNKITVSTKRLFYLYFTKFNYSI
jgi:hypothetical protein